MPRLCTIYPAVSPVVRIPRGMQSQLHGHEHQLTLEWQRQGDDPLREASWTGYLGIVFESVGFHSLAHLASLLTPTELKSPVETLRR